MTSHTIVIPTLNEEEEIRSCLLHLQGIRAQGIEIIVVDGGSTDRTMQLVEGLCDRFISTSPGRAVQMNAGARKARGELIFFLHVDTRLPERFPGALATIEPGENRWGRFDVKLSGKQWPYRVIETLINLRSRITGVATGDQVIFMSQDIYHAVGGFPDIALMEDIEISHRLKKICSPICLRQKVVTSSRRWEKNGIIKTIFKMWWLRLSYFIGVDPDHLARQYD